MDAAVGTEQVAHPQGEASILVIESAGSVSVIKAWL
ncbi:hypothetical protein ND16A_2561 [Thalassotalea sp. ND16A]|nr:hypothetical protein ND16A_2561 [Thalassotalea sp. ND16A]